MNAAPRLIETVRVRDSLAPLWGLHLRRLAGSCQALGVPFPRALTVPAGGPDRVHRLEVSGDGVHVTERAVESGAPVRLHLARERYRPYPHKTTDRAQFETALAEARAAGADDALFLAEGVGYVAEAARWSIFWWEGGQLCGPPLDLGILPGVARARLAELAGPVAERRVTLDHILDRHPFVANAVRGVVATAAIGEHLVMVDERTRSLAARFWLSS